MAEASNAAIDARPLHHRWIRTVQGMLNSLGLMGLSDEQLETLLSPLEKSIAVAEARQASGEADPDGNTEVDADAPQTDVEPDAGPDFEPDAGPDADATAEPSLPGDAEPGQSTL